MKTTALKVPMDWKLQWKELLLVSTLILASPFLQGGLSSLQAEAETEFLSSQGTTITSYRVYRSERASESQEIVAHLLHGPLQSSESPELNSGLRSDLRRSEMRLVSEEPENWSTREPSRMR